MTGIYPTTVFADRDAVVICCVLCPVISYYLYVFNVFHPLFFMSRLNV